MKLVEQEDPSGCAAACLAMILGCNYQKAKELFPEPQKFESPTLGAGGVKREVLDSVLAECGYAVARRFNSHGPFGFYHIVEVTDPVTFAATSSWHFVVMDCIGKVYDPGTGTLGSSKIHSSLEPYSLILAVAAIVRLP